MVVARSEGRQVAETMESDSVLGRAEADSTGVAGNLAFGDVVRGLSTDEETIAAENGISGEGRALIVTKNRLISILYGTSKYER